MKNRILYLFALLWCGRKNLEKRRSYDRWSERLRESALGEHGLVGTVSEHSLRLYVAKDGHRLGANGEYLAYIGGINYHTMDARQKADYVRMWQMINLFDLHYEYEGENEHAKWYKVKESFANYLFWYRKDLPKGVHPILLRSNGSIAKGYWRRNGDIIEIYRPNPNAWEVFNPLWHDRIGWKTWHKINAQVII